MEITQDEQQQQNFFKNEESLQDLYDNIKYTNIHIIGVPEEKRERRGKILFE